jgi:predicted O-methyltransferase YrrM
MSSDTQAQTHVAHDSHGGQIHVTSYQPDWTRSDEYHNSFVLKADESLDKALAHQRSSDLPDIAVSEAHGKLLYLVARSIGAKRVLEVGTLGG